MGEMGKCFFHEVMADFLGQVKNGISTLTLNKKVNEKIEIY